MTTSVAHLHGGPLDGTTQQLDSADDVVEFTHTARDGTWYVEYRRDRQGDDGWQILRGTMLESMYGDGVPKSGYGNERGEFNQVNRISPGGLSHPNCAIDFTDISSMFARAVVEGFRRGAVQLRLFGEVSPSSR